MIDEKELCDWISKLEAAQSSWPNYEKLAALYTIQNQCEMRGNRAEAIAYSGAADPGAASIDSDFMLAVMACDAGKAWSIMDELMDALKVTNSRVYDSVMRKMRG